VGSLLRTAEGLGVSKVILTGYTPYPLVEPDQRLPHLAAKIDRQISKTALGAEKTQAWEHHDDVIKVLEQLKNDGYTLTALEQTKTAIPLPEFQPPNKVAIVLGREVEGVETEVLQAVDTHLVIPMFGQKESFNVVQAAAMALYQCRFA
jgi:tRNA G18 (ribose-2'-O)-methylase SpoU